MALSLSGSYARKYRTRSSLGIESRNPHVPTCRHLRTVYLPAVNPIADLFNWRLRLRYHPHHRGWGLRAGIVLPTMATRLHSTGQVETTFRLPIGSCRDTHGRILARKLGGRQSVYIAARSACWRQKQVSVVPQFESAALDCGCRTAPAATIWLGRNREQIPPWPFGRERFTAVPTGIGGCWPAMTNFAEAAFHHPAFAQELP
jgi:hypothetical protein